MAEELDALTPVPLGRPPTYPWGDWMNGRPWRIRRGEDFDIEAQNMARVVRGHAYRNRVRATARVVDGDTVEFQFKPESEERAA